MLSWCLLYDTRITSFCFLFKVSGGTEPDLIVRAKETNLYVCRVNNHFDNFVFSEWVKVKVLDIDKSGNHYVVFMITQLGARDCFVVLHFRNVVMFCNM